MISADVVEIETTTGDPGYFVRGHFDLEEFVVLVNALHNEEFEPLEAEHVWLTQTKPNGAIDPPYRPEDPPEEGDTYWFCPKEEKDAFPVTFVCP